MKKQLSILFTLMTITCAAFLSCDSMAELFHGPKPAVAYTVTFNANGANGTPPAAQTVNEGAVINLPDKGGLSKGSDILAGWNENASGGGTSYSVGASITVTKDMVFYAQWLDASTPQYTVTFNINGAKGGVAPASQTVYSGFSITLPGQGTLTYSGRTFGGWNTQANGGGTNYEAGTVYTVTGNITLYARWQSDIQYIVTYNANGASGAAPTAQSVDPGTIITLPGVGSMTNSGKTFNGWNTQANGGGTSYAEGTTYTVNANVTFYALWLSEPVEPPGATLVEKLAYIRSNAGDGMVYDIVVNNNEYIGPQTVSTMGRNITVIIHSVSSADVKTIQLEGDGHLFSVDNNITLKLQDIVLKGISANRGGALVMVGQGGILILNSGTKITLNNSYSNNPGNPKGGGIYVNGGVLELNEGSEISENTAGYDISGSSYTLGWGGGIYVENSGRVVIRGGLITKNYSFGAGAGIHITGNSTVNMTGGVISKNIVKGSGYGGGGVFVSGSGSSFTKRAASGSSTSGIIYGGTGENANSASSTGHAVYRDTGTKKSRNSTLGYYDEISTLSDEGWE